jgi:phosphoglycerate dehydrogenase-like enzyme
MKIVIYPGIEPDRLAALMEAAPEARFENAFDEGQAVEAMPGAEAVLGKVTPRMLARADRLRWVQSFTASLEHYVFPELVEHPCTLTNMRGLFGDVIADQVMGYVLCFARNLHTYVHHQIEHRYEPAGGEAARVSFAAGPGTVNAMDRATIFLPGATMGVVGFGAIGAEVARRAMAFGITVHAVDRFPERCPRVEGVEEVWPVDRLPNLLSQSDFVVIAAPHTPETEGLFDAETIGKMRRSSFLINVGRGAIVIIGDLVDALSRGVIAGAALDVFEVEPLSSDHPLWDFPNVIITPHTAGYSPVVAPRHLAALTSNLRRFVKGEPLANVVEKSLWF